MDILETIIIVAATVGIQTLIIMALGNKFLKYAFDKLQEAFTGPTVSKAFGILGGKSGEARRNRALENEIATGALDSILGKWKIPLSIIGVDLDDLLERYSPMDLLGALQTFLPMLKSAGIDVSQLVGQVTGGTAPPQSSNRKIGL